MTAAAIKIAADAQLLTIIAVNFRASAGVRAFVVKWKQNLPPGAASPSV